MRGIIVFVLILFSLNASAHNGTKKTWWQSFCEKHLITWSPEDGFNDVQFLKGIASSNGELDLPLYIDLIVKRYRAIGGKLHWMGSAARERGEYEVHLKVLRGELELILKQPKLNVYQIGFILEALEDYPTSESLP